MIRVSGRDMRRFGYVRKRGTSDFSSPRVLSISVWPPVPPRFDTPRRCPWQPDPEPHMAAQEALPDGMREAASDVCLIAHERVATKQAAGKAPARAGFDDMAPAAVLLALRICACYSTQLAPCIQGHLVRNAVHGGLWIRLLRCRGTCPPLPPARWPAMPTPEGKPPALARAQFPR